VSIVTRRLLFIVLLSAVVWILGIVCVIHQVPQRNAYNFVINYSRPGQVWGVRLIWWSIWLTILWGGTFLVC